MLNSHLALLAVCLAHSSYLAHLLSLHNDSPPGAVPPLNASMMCPPCMCQVVKPSWCGLGSACAVAVALSWGRPRGSTIRSVSAWASITAAVLAASALNYGAALLWVRYLHPAALAVSNGAALAGRTGALVASPALSSLRLAASAIKLGAAGTALAIDAGHIAVSMSRETLDLLSHPWRPAALPPTLSTALGTLRALVERQPEVLSLQEALSHRLLRTPPSSPPPSPPPSLASPSTSPPSTPQSPQQQLAADEAPAPSRLGRWRSLAIDSAMGSAQRWLPAALVRKVKAE